MASATRMFIDELAHNSIVCRLRSRVGPGDQIPPQRLGASRPSAGQEARGIPPCADRRRGHLQHGRRHRRSAATRGAEGESRRLADGGRGAFARRAGRYRPRPRRAAGRRSRPSRSRRRHNVQDARLLRRLRLREEAGHRLVPLHAAGLRLQRWPLARHPRRGAHGAAADAGGELARGASSRATPSCSATTPTPMG